MDIVQRTNQKAYNGWQDFVMNGSPMHVYALEIATFPRGKKLGSGLVLQL